MEELITKEMVERYYELNLVKKKIEAEINQLKKIFHTYFDNEYGENEKGELIKEQYKLQRQVRKTEKWAEKDTVEKLEELNMNDLIQIVKTPDSEKIHAAIELGLLKKSDIEGCLTNNYTKAITVKAVK
ncbi:hypothetical protein NSA56_00545 [Oceanobacillus caeni]|uniref:hypothetical protein n=1 Tax=Bacillaceae TaxID=186817 RepID=UPI000621CA7A|nr:MULTISPECIES: hypothetical protein [Bacillaceae]KKE80225.1 hypothetical protein WH51_02795 [Bacilli bacterium VT-13-104]PZD88018.1 hypothetical protein DEJ64_04815 [Bacilli bacterium]MCR1832883.1 hypothetical protein [Oceanobacillus caeni]PZD90209.1 hypothetical protein DEJ60_03880 [Bacilli bacterium]PZD92103.1 hypothetical protein DEJ66_04335 [Bacilli bacterium]